MSTAYAFDPVRRPGPVAPFPSPARPVDAARDLAGSPAVAPRAAPFARPRVLAGVAVFAGVVCVVVVQLLLSIATANGAYRLADLHQRSEVLSRQQQVQTEELRALAAPQRLASRAAALGMVPDDSPAYLDARTGKVLGSTSATEGTAERPGGITR